MFRRERLIGDLESERSSTMKKKVWILNHHANSMFFDEGGRHYSFAKYLKKAGYEPSIFCSNAEHGTGKLYFDKLRTARVHMAKKIGVPFVFIKGRGYKSNGLDRVLCMFDYYFNVRKYARIYAEKKGKPDVIIASSVHPLACVAGIWLARNMKVPCIVEIRDLWPESIVAYHVASSKDVLIKALYRLEKWIYAKADAIIFTVGGGKDYIKEKKWDTVQGGKVNLNKVYYINNGVDLESFDANKKECQLHDEDLDDERIVKVVYTGSIRHANNVGALLDIAKNVDSSIKFLIWGDGDEACNLKERVRKENIKNVVFKERVEKKYIPYIVTKADVNVMDMQETNGLFRFGISPNKLFDYLAAKRPVVMYQLDKYNPALEYGVGFVADKFSEIAHYLNGFTKPQKEERDELRYEKARQAFSYENLTRKLIKIIEGV